MQNDNSNTGGGSASNLQYTPDHLLDSGDTKLQQTLPLDIAFLHRYGISKKALGEAAYRSTASGEPAANQLIADGTISETDYYICMAHYLGLPFDDTEISIKECIGELGNQSNLIENAKLLLVKRHGPLPMIYTSPDSRILGMTLQETAKHPSLKGRVVITTYSNTRRTFIARRRQSLVSSAVFLLKKHSPGFSASTIITKFQTFTFVFISLALVFGLFFAKKMSVYLIHLIGSVFYLMCVWVKMIAAVYSVHEEPAETAVQTEFSEFDLPIYSVLVALYREENQVEDLVKALTALEWPRSKLEIKLICEGDDHACIAAVNKAISGLPFELVIVPPTLPRTKPKALNFALPLCRGQFLVLYDAEDRPHPKQLLEAYSQFECTDKSLACLQAPLVIHNSEHSWLTSLFAIEYSALFSGLLPTLANWQTPIPLGGTSNHFRRSALEQVGAWDPYNVTEDADLGIRLSRKGYRIGTLRCPTFEEAPANFNPWVKQRTRWFKGWLQTWLVHMRNPARLQKDLGWFNTFIFHAIITGMLVSALFHPFFLVSLGITLYYIAISPELDPFYVVLAIIDISNILFGYLAFSVLAWRSLPISDLTRLRPKLVGIPVYWLLISLAAWRAVWHLIRRPFEWEKTPHVISSSDNQYPND